MDPRTDIPPQNGEPSVDRKDEQRRPKSGADGTLGVILEPLNQAGKLIDNVIITPVRSLTPAPIVNHAMQGYSLLRVGADSFSLHSALNRDKLAWYRLSANVVSLSTLALGTIFGDKPISEEDKRRYATMNPLQYTGARLAEAADPQNHFATTLGVSTMMNGFLTAAQGFHDRKSGHHITGKEWRQGLFTVLAGGLLTFMQDRERAWQLSQLIFTVRIPDTYGDAAEKMRMSDPKKRGEGLSLMTKFGLQQTANTIGLFYGGIKKDEKGRIIHVEKSAGPDKDQDKSPLVVPSPPPPQPLAQDNQPPTARVAEAQLSSRTAPLPAQALGTYS